MQHSNSTNVPFADRDCTHVDSHFMTPSTPSHNSLPRRRSLYNGSQNHQQSSSSLASAAQAGYLHRKAAKAVLERRRSSTVFNNNNTFNDENDSTGANNENKDKSVINVTVDAGGSVRIQPKTTDNREAFFAARRKSQRNWKPVNTSTSISNINNSNHHNNMNTSPTTTTNTNPTATDHSTTAVANAITASIPPELLASPQQPHPPQSEDEWDGSMPRRHSSKSFIERRASVSSVGVAENLRRALEITQSTNNNNNNNTTESQQTQQQQVPERQPFTQLQTSTTTSFAPSSHRTHPKNKHKSVTAKSSKHKSGSGRDGNSNKNKKQSKSSTTSTMSIAHPQQHQHQPQQPQPEDTTTHGKPITSTITTENNTCAPHHEPRMPDEGRWCDKCAGVGLMVAALLNEQRQKSASVSSASVGNVEGNPESSGSSIGGWRSVVLGDGGKSKLIAENTRLVKENKALYDVMHQLQKRFNEHIAGGNVDN